MLRDEFMSMGGISSRTKFSTRIPVLSGIAAVPATSVKAVLLIVMKQLPRDVQMKGFSLMVAISSSVSTIVTMLLFSLICSEPPVRVKRLMSGDSDVRLCKVNPVGVNDRASTVSEKATVSIPRALLNCTNLLIVGAELSAVKAVGLSPVVMFMASSPNVSAKAPSAYVRKQVDRTVQISLAFMRLRSSLMLTVSMVKSDILFNMLLTRVKLTGGSVAAV